MKFLEGKTPAERNKIIAAIILGGIAVLALTYTLSGFFFTPKVTAGGTKTPTPTPAAVVTNNGGQSAQQDPSILADLDWMLSTPVIYTQTAFSGNAGRNVFAFYEPPLPTPYSPTPVPPPVFVPPSPTPTPPFTLAYVAPSSIFAGSKSFRLEVVGDKFTPDARIVFNGSELPTNFVNAQKLTADIPAVLISGEGARQIMVRTPDGKLYSFPAMLQVQAPPQPNYNYIGLVEKKHRNNDMVILQDKTKTTEMASYRLNDTVGDRFRLISISAREVVLEDKSLGFKHRLNFIESKGSTGSGTAGIGGGSGINGGFGGRNAGQGTGLPNSYPAYPGGPGGPNGPNPTVGPPTTEIAPGIRVPATPNPNSNVRQPNKKDYEDDDDDGPNR